MLLDNEREKLLLLEKGNLEKKRQSERHLGRATSKERVRGRGRKAGCRVRCHAGCKGG